MTTTNKLSARSHPSPTGEGKGLPAETTVQAGVRLFIAKLVFNIVTGTTVKRNQFEEQLRLVEAESLEEAFLKARGLGISQEETIYRDGQPTTRWQFVDVADLLLVPALGNGTEIYSQIHETDESREYIHNVHQRGMAIRLNAIQFA